jgi:hypothetical protein
VCLVLYLFFLTERTSFLPCVLLQCPDAHSRVRLALDFGGSERGSRELDFGGTAYNG